MIRRIALTLVPCVTLYTVAACLSSSVAPHVDQMIGTVAEPATTDVQHLAARSGYIVASS